MSDENKDALTPVEANEANAKNEMTTEQKELAEKIGKAEALPKNVKEKLLKGEKLNFADILMGYINESAGSPFSVPVFGEMAYYQLAPIILEEKHTASRGQSHSTRPIGKID